MTTKKSSKTIRSRIRRTTHNDIFTAFALFSILANVLLLVTIFVFLSPDSYSLSTVKDVTNKYCDTTFSASNYADTAAKNGQTVAQVKAQHDITCKTASFMPYYQQAVNSYQQSKK